MRCNQKLIESAYHHLEEEFGLENIRPSLAAGFEDLQKAHDAVHEFMLLAPLLVPSSLETGWHEKSAFLVCHWEVCNQAHRSLIEALCAYYNPAFVLLRVAFELLVKGAFWQCMIRKEFRSNSEVLKRDKAGRKLVELFERLFTSAPDLKSAVVKSRTKMYH